ncbi:MAG: hypothetical protein FD176_163 [Rhodospirillaceae bacterium]|nr:MAG: hypothetical protein FD176_163 [Rhodospirillaceae bacterium]TNC98681.1 MAG: hypothetical protein FD119_152 [Stygiobacter sp.]
MLDDDVNAPWPEGTDLVPVSSSTAIDIARPLPEILQQAVETAEVLTQSARATSTNRFYASDWRLFTNWCVEYEGHGAVPLPAEPEIVTAYIGHLYNAGRAYSTVVRKIAAIRAYHQEHLAQVDAAHRARKRAGEDRRGAAGHHGAHRPSSGPRRPGGLPAPDRRRSDRRHHPGPSVVQAESGPVEFDGRRHGLALPDEQDRHPGPRPVADRVRRSAAQVGTCRHPCRASDVDARRCHRHDPKVEDRPGRHRPGGGDLQRAPTATCRCPAGVVAGVRHHPRAGVQVPASWRPSCARGAGYRLRGAPS